MANRFEFIADRLSCPDDGAKLACAADHLRCTVCEREFPIVEEDVVDLRPAKLRELDADFASEMYRQGHLSEATKPLVLSPNAMGWGAQESVPTAWTERRRRQRDQVLPLLQAAARPDLVLCDLAAGAGYYSFEYAHSFHTVIHCDLSSDALSYAHHKAAAAGIRNMVFVRMDYLQPPFRNSLDRLICLDTLIRGEKHELQLLNSIRGSLSPAGVAVVDFHNWWHNPLRRLGLFRDNFRGNRSYSRSQVEGLLRKAAVGPFEYFPFRQDLDDNGASYSPHAPAIPLSWKLRWDHTF
jgi:SAM-dependent methyltransferase